MSSWNLLALTMRALTVTRWSVYPRIERWNALEHVGYRLHIALVLAYALREQGIEFSLDTLLRRGLVAVAEYTLISDLSGPLRSRVSAVDPSIRDSIDSFVLDALSAGNIPPFFTDMYRQKCPVEDAILRSASILANTSQVLPSSRVFPEAYSMLLVRLRAEARAPWLYCEMLPENARPYTEAIRRLQAIERWNRSHRTQRVSVLAHLVVVAITAWSIAHMESRSDEETTDMILRALFHDIPESLTGDVITPVKRGIPGFLKALEIVEREMVQEDLWLNQAFPHDYARFQEYMLSPWDTGVGASVKIADRMSAVLEAIVEARSNGAYEKTARAVIVDFSTAQHPLIKELLGMVESFEESPFLEKSS